MAQQSSFGSSMTLNISLAGIEPDPPHVRCAPYTKGGQEPLHHSSDP